MQDQKLRLKVKYFHTKPSISRSLLTPQLPGAIVYVRQSVCKFFSIATQKLAQKINARQLTRTFQKLTRTVTCEEKKHMSIDTLEIQMTRITRQLEYYKLQLKYLENITHNMHQENFLNSLTYFCSILLLQFSFATGS